MELSCTFKNQTGYYSSAKIYTCIITSAMITKPGTSIKAINGSHQAGKTNKDVKVVSFYSAIVEHSPRGLGKIFPNLTHLEIESCGLKEISRRDLVGLEKLKVLYLSDNQIESLLDDLFIGMKSLKFINFSQNKISCASSKLLEPIEKQLKIAYFNGNQKINVDYENLSPATLIDLKRQLDRCYEPVDKTTNSSITLDFPETIASKVERMWTSGDYSDFTILVHKKEFKVHKCILGTQSSFFKAMFAQEMQENLTGKMTIDVFRAEIVEEFLKFFYTGVAPSAFNALEVFKIASMYDMKKSAVKMVNSNFTGKFLNDSVFEDCELLTKIIEVKCFLDLHFME